jgi:hypothetical protein
VLGEDADLDENEMRAFLDELVAARLMVEEEGRHPPSSFVESRLCWDHFRRPLTRCGTVDEHHPDKLSSVS